MVARNTGSCDPGLVSVLRPSIITAKTLGRTLGIWPFLFLIVWALVIRIQEPPFFARLGVEFFWSSQQAMLLFGVGLLPLAWRLSQGAEAAKWVLRSARSGGLPVLSTWLGIVIYGGSLLVCGIFASAMIEMLTLHRMNEQPFPWDRALSAMLHAGAFLIVTASLAPGLALVPWSTTMVIFLWLPIQALALQGFGPSKFLEVSGAATAVSGIVSTLLATLGGLAVSLAHAHHRLRH